MITVPGNKAVVDALTLLLAQAKQGRAAYFIGLMVSEGERPSGGWFGSPLMETAAMRALEQLAVGMDAAVLNRKLPSRGENVPADRVCYNVPASPISYDFTSWLIDAEMTRIREGAPAPLKVAFWFGRNGKEGLHEANQQMFHRVMKPMLGLVGAVEEPDAVDGRYKECFVFRDIVSGARAGDTVPMFYAPDFMRAEVAKKFGGYVTITLRESAEYPHRNSDVATWVNFAHYLKRNGERVVFVRDTAKAHDWSDLDGFEIFPEASIDLRWRTGLYACAKMNMFTSNGPATLAFFSDWPWMAFIKIEPDGHIYAPSTASFWREQCSMNVGEQFPWSRSDQRIVWKEATYDSLVEAWNGMCLSDAASVAAE